MKKLFLIVITSAPAFLFAQDTIIVQTETVGTFETITYEVPEYDTVYTEATYAAPDGGTVTIFRTQFSSERKVNAPIIENVKLAVYPNPGKGVYEIASSAVFIRTDVYSILGEVLLSKEFTEPNGTAMDITTLPKGVYFLKVTYLDGATRTVKVIFQ